MLFVLIMLWTISATLLLIDRRSGSTRWLAVVAFCGGSGALAAVIGERLLPFAQAKEAGEALLGLLFQVQVSASLLSYYGLPVAFLLFALHYTRPDFFVRRPRLFVWLLAIPALVTLWLRPAYTAEYPIHFRIVIIWALPYIVAGSFMMLARKEWNRTARQIHWMACLAVLLPVLFSAAMNYVLPSMGLYKMWRYNAWIIPVGFLLFVLALFNYGFLGIRFRIQRRQLDSTLRAITSGTAILNHGIKNDVGKIKLFGEKIKAHARGTAQAELEADAEVIVHAAGHIEQMIRRVHEQTKELALVREPFDLTAALDDWLKGIMPKLDERRIALIRDYRYQGLYDGDRVQLTEAVGNVITNAIEAMEEGGALTIRVRPLKKHIEIVVEDTGEGIPAKELPSVLEPFYTTKSHRRSNFGLGLAYSYHVVKKHGGTLDIWSEEGKGTVVSIRLGRGMRNGTD